MVEETRGSFGARTRASSLPDCGGASLFAVACKTVIPHSLPLAICAGERASAESFAEFRAQAVAAATAAGEPFIIFGGLPHRD
jgi:hypothetical protein